jgi:hypothetical protein
MARIAKGKSFNDCSGEIADANASQMVVAENEHRSSFVFQNISAGTLWLDFGRAAVQRSPSFRVLSGELFRMEKEAGFVDQSDVFVIGGVAGAEYVAREGGND